MLLKLFAVTAAALLLPAYGCFAAERSALAFDLHSHIILREHTDLLAQHGAELEETFPLPSWSVEEHLKFMDEAGIETSVLTMPAPQPYYGDADESRAVVSRINGAAGAEERGHGGRFLYCAALPLPDVQGAIDEAIYALDVLGADGVKLASNSRGQYLGDEELDPLMEVLNERGAVIIIHPHRPTPYPEKIIETTPLAMYEYTAETTRAVVNMISRDVLKRYPNLKVVVPHAGSFLPLAVPRMQAVLPVFLAQGMLRPVDWEANLSRLYYDLAGDPSPEQIKTLLTITEPGHIMYGSDYPYRPAKICAEGLAAAHERWKADAELAPYAEMFLSENARALFGGGQNINKTE